MFFREEKKTNIFAVIAWTILAVAALASATYFVFKFLEKRRIGKYLDFDCDCFDTLENEDEIAFESNNSQDQNTTIQENEEDVKISEENQY